MIEGFTEFLSTIVSFFQELLVIIQQTTDLLNGVNFSESVIAKYLGYPRYVMGAPLWTLFTTVLLIPLGVTIWIYSLKGIDLLKKLFSNS